MKDMTKEDVLDLVREDKEFDEIGIELNEQEVAMLEECRDDFVSEVGKIYGSCKMEMEDAPDGYKMLTIKRRFISKK